MPAACAAARLCARALRARNLRRSPPPGAVPRKRGGTSSTRVTRGAWRATSCAAQGQRARVRIWAHASGHVSQARQEWLQGHARPAQQAGGGRVMGCRLPRQRPWLNPMEPTWVQGNGPWWTLLAYSPGLHSCHGSVPIRGIEAHSPLLCFKSHPHAELHPQVFPAKEEPRERNESASSGSLNHVQNVHRATLAVSSKDAGASSGTFWNASISGMKKSPLQTRMMT